MLKVGLVGVGGISGAHIPAWESLEDTVLTALCDIRPERMQPWPQKRCYTDFDEMLQKEELDILDICLPTWLHVPFAVKAMEKKIANGQVPGVEDLKEQLLERDILIRSCANYHGLGPDFYRVCVRREEENKQLIQAMREVL